MSEGISGRQLAKALKVSETAVRKAVKAGRIKADADGKFDLAACQAAWGAATDPGRSKVREPANRTREPANPGSHPAVRTVVRTDEDARAAVALIARVLRAEGAEDDDAPIDYAKARTAETILKAYERDLKIAMRRRELVPAASVRDHVAKAFIGFRQTVQRIPSRHAAAVAAELGCDPTALEAAWSKVTASELDALSTPVVRT